METFDVVIVGSGLVGATLACALGKDCRVAVIDQKMSPPAESSLTSETKAMALSWPSVICLKNLGVWPLIESVFFPIFRVHVSKQKRFGNVDLRALEIALPFLGGVIDANSLNKALVDVAKTLKKVQFFQPDVIQFQERKKEGWDLYLQSQKRLFAPLLVAADGAHSMLCKTQGIHHVEKNHRQVAIVAAVTVESEQPGTAFEHFLENGAIALLPFGQKMLKSVWVMEQNRYESLKDLPDTDYLAQLQANVGYRAGRFHRVFPRSVYPLQSRVAESLYQDRFVVIGNAANQLHPIAAQGFNLGLRDAAFLAEKMIEAQKTGIDSGSLELLRSYAKTREKDHEQTRQFLGMLTEFNKAQEWGILGSTIPAVKRWIMKQSLGERVTLPKLCRGIVK